MKAYQGSIKDIIENGYCTDFIADKEEDIKEMKDLWKNIYTLCLHILQDSMKLIYSGNQQIMENLEVSLGKAHFDYKHAENSTLLLTYLCQPENIRKILETKETSQKAFAVFEKCTKIAYDHVLE